MPYTIKDFAYKIAHSESPETLASSLDTPWENNAFDNYDASKSLGKSRHLSAATKLWSSTTNKLLITELLSNCIEKTPHKVGVFLAVENINLEDDFVFDLCAKNYGPDYVSPLQAPNTLANVVGSHFARFSGAQGPNCTISAGQSSGLQALDLAALNLDNTAIDIAIIGGVEVKSNYHTRLNVESRDVAVSCVITAASDQDTFIFYPPSFQTLAVITEDAIAKKIASSIATHLKHTQIDIVCCISANNSINEESLHSAIASQNISQCLMVSDRLFGKGESCNALILMALAKEIMDSDGVINCDFLTPALLGHCPETIRTMAIVTVDSSGQIAVLILEKT